MNRTIIIALVTAVAVVSAAAAIYVFTDDQGESDTGTMTATLYLDPNNGSDVSEYEYSGPPKNICDFIEKVMEEKGHEISIANNGKIRSVDGTSETDTNTWVLWKWEKGEWKIVSSLDVSLNDEGIYMLCFSGWSMNGTERKYIPSTCEIKLPVYVLLIQEDKVVWMKGKGTNAVNAITDAFANAGIEFDAPASGWVSSIDGRTQNVDQNSDGTYLYHVQYRLEGKNWIYNDLVLSYYDLAEYNTFAFVWSLSYSDDSFKNGTPLKPVIPGFEFLKYVYEDDGLAYDVRNGYTDRRIEAIWA